MAQERMDREMAERMQAEEAERQRVEAADRQRVEAADRRLAEALQERENGHTDESDPGEGHSRSLARAASKRSKSKNIDSVSSSSAAICNQQSAISTNKLN